MNPLDDAAGRAGGAAFSRAAAGALSFAAGEAAATPPKLQTTVVRGVLHKGSITLVYGMPKSGKSFLATDLALAVAHPQRALWMGHRILQHGPVLYVACEGHGGFWKRLRATGQLVPDQFILATGRPRLIINPDASGHVWVPEPCDVMQGLQWTLQEFGCNPVFIVIDTVFRSFGGANVNDSSHMMTYVAAVQEIADQELSVVLVHHSTKRANTPAGSISLIGAADTLIVVKKKTDGTHVWEVEEAKDDAETPPREFVLEVVDGIEDAVGDYVSSCKVIDKGPHKREARAEKKKSEKPKEPRSRTANAEGIYCALIGVFAKPGVPLGGPRGPQRDRYERRGDCARAYPGGGAMTAVSGNETRPVPAVPVSGLLGNGGTA
jgi:hypothetical protein